MEQRRLRLLSYNIAAGLSTAKYSDYLTHSWKQVLPVPSRMINLDAIAGLISEYDVVGLQEVDRGSLRSGFVDQVKYLTERSAFEYAFDQSNRRIGVLTQHSNAILTRMSPTLVEDHKLPGVIPGRGLLLARYGEGEDALHVFIMHMALGKRGRMRQIRFLADLIGGHRYVIVMGDLNCRSDSPEMRELLRLTHLCEPAPGLYTFPSWNPDRQLDHILVSPTIEVERVQVLQCPYSDHLPLAMDVVLPEELCRVA